jgi:hypothetical protein
MTVYRDATDFVLSTLQANTALTDLIVDGAEGIYESGSIDPTALAAAEKARMEDDTPNLLLAVLVQDAGEKAQGERNQTQRVALYFYDRNRQYENIRAARAAAWRALINKTCALDGPFTGLAVMKALQFEERTGMLKDHRLELYYERVVFIAPVSLEMG